MLKLHDLSLSGNCYKVRLFLALLGIECEFIAVDFMAGQHKTPEYLALNPRGEIPILQDEDFTLCDSQAILVYLASKYASEAWLPQDAVGLGQVMQWLSTAANEIARGPNDARLAKKFGYKLDLATAQKKAHHILPIVDQHLSQQNWLTLGRPTIADIACFPYIALAPEGEVMLEEYGAINQWIDRIKQLPNFVGMPGIDAA
ncbi:MAG: glutathione S-transferase [Cyanobacteria bacterium J06639_14]